MKKFSFAVLLTVFSVSVLAQETSYPLVEVFTNSHCGVCPSAHNALDNFTSSNNEAHRVSFIYYHMRYPYSNDPLYQHNPIDSDARDQYYGPYFSTPHGIFNGVRQNNTYSQWGGSLSNLLNNSSPLKITLSGTKSENEINISAEIFRSGDIQDSDLRLHFVVVETVDYTGNNGINPHKNVMRKMIPDASGQAIVINQGATVTIEKNISLNSQWISDSLKVVVFIQGEASKTVYQSGTIKYADLSAATSVAGEQSPGSFELEQNYPNPFNPSTRIGWYTPVESFQSLKVFDMLGREVAVLVNEVRPAGYHEAEFNAGSVSGSLSSGVYFYRLQAGDYTEIRKMILNK